MYLNEYEYNHFRKGLIEILGLKEKKVVVESILNNQTHKQDRFFHFRLKDLSILKEFVDYGLGTDEYANLLTRLDEVDAPLGKNSEINLMHRLTNTGLVVGSGITEKRESREEYDRVKTEQNKMQESLDHKRKKPIAFSFEKTTKDTSPPTTPTPPNTPPTTPPLTPPSIEKPKF